MSGEWESFNFIPATSSFSIQGLGGQAISLCLSRHIRLWLFSLTCSFGVQVLFTVCQILYSMLAKESSFNHYSNSVIFCPYFADKETEAESWSNLTISQLLSGRTRIHPRFPVCFSPLLFSVLVTEPPLCGPGGLRSRLHLYPLAPISTGSLISVGGAIILTLANSFPPTVQRSIKSSHPLALGFRFYHLLAEWRREKLLNFCALPFLYL
jgi:hypothetical protein